MDSLRKNNKRLMSLDQATALLRANGEIRAVDDDGRPLSVSTVSRALRTYGLHPDQLLRPAPHSELRSLQENIEDFYRNTRLTRSIVELRNAVTTGLKIAESAWSNRTSRGCHFRKD